MESPTASQYSLGSLGSPASSRFSIDSVKSGHSRMSSVATARSLSHSPATAHPRADSGTSTALSRVRLPTQIRRCLPLYSICIVLIIVFTNLASQHSSPTPSNGLKKRQSSSQRILSTNTFPRKLWQTWKSGPLGFEENHMQCARTWTQKNPGHRYEVLTDDNDLQYIEEHYGILGINRPDILDMYRALKAPIVKADLLRYLVMYAEGGVYADIDVEALRPVQRFIPDRYDERDVEMVIGVEIDQPEFKDHPILGKKSQSFCQWTFMCKPRLPVMLLLIENIMAWLNEVARRQNVSVSEIVLDFDEVLTGTGPSAFTEAILLDMTEKAGGTPVTWAQFHNLPESKLVHGVLILTVEAFAAGQGHSDSGNHDARSALVKHHYHASGWPSKHPRYNHPIYGPVEICNWVVECVKKWDEDVATFDALPEDERNRYLEIKEEGARQEREEQERKIRLDEQEKAIADIKAVQINNELAAKQAEAEETLKKYGEAEEKARQDTDALNKLGELERRREKTKDSESLQS